MQQCPQLTKLQLQEFRTTDAQLADCLAGLPLLRFLSLFSVSGLQSLSFLPSGPIPSSLTSLSLAGFRCCLPVRELECIRSLRRSACADCSIRNESERLLEFRVPSAAMPSLRAFESSGMRP